MRAKGSDRNKAISVALADIATIHTDSGETDLIRCCGHGSVFSLFSACFPDFARDDKDMTQKNRQGVSVAEMNKCLLSAGYKTLRKRDRVLNQIVKPKRGGLRWRFRRWVDPTNEGDLEHLRTKLAEMHHSYPETECCNEENLIAQLQILTKRHDSSSRGSKTAAEKSPGGDDGTESSANILICESQQGLAFLGELHLHELNETPMISFTIPNHRTSNICKVFEFESTLDKTSTCLKGTVVEWPILDDFLRASALKVLNSWKDHCSIQSGLLRSNHHKTVIEWIDSFFTVGASGLSVDEILHKQALVPLISSLSALDNAPPAAQDENHKIAPWRAFGSSFRAGLLSSRIFSLSAGHPSLSASCCLRLLDADCDPFPQFAGCPDWAQPVLNCIYQHGWSESDLISEFSYLPSSVAEAIQAAVFSLMVLATSRLRNPCTGELALDDMKENFEFAWLSIDPFEGLHDSRQPGLGIVRRIFEPSTCRTKEFFCNDTFCQMAQLSIDEVLARFGKNELSLPLVQLDHICIVLDSMYNFFQLDHSQCFRWQWPGAEPTLVKRTVTKAFNDRGLCWQETMRYTVLTPEEFDAHCAAEVSSSSCIAALRAAVGDQRSGAQLLADMPSDRLITIEMLSGCASGRETLTRLAAAVVRLFEPFVSAARLCCAHGAPTSLS